MSIYNPPSKTQGIFNPSNYGGLGAGGQITTDYLDANYLQFPVAQGNMTLVGTNILGDVTQQGEIITTGDITGETIEGTSFLVGTTNLLTEIGTKQDTIQDNGLTIAKTDGLQTALDNKYDDTGGTIGGDVTINGDLVIGTTNVITEIGTKQDEINDGDLTIAKTDGLQTALDNKYDDTGGTIGGDVTINGDLVIGTTNVITEIGTKQDTIDDGDLTIAKTDGLQTALDNKYDDTGGTIGGDVTINGDLVIGTTNVITEIGTKQDEINDGDLTIAKTDGLQTALDNKYDDTGGTIGGDVTINGDLVIGTTNVITEIGTKQDTIDDGDLTIAKTDGLQTALDNKYDDTGGTIGGDVTINGDLVIGTTNVITEIGTKQDEINDGDLTIAKTDGLQTALDNKYDDTGGTIDGNVTINGDLVVGSTNIIDEIGTKQDEINDGDLTIAKTDGLQTALDNKYDDTGGTIGGNVTISGDLVIGTTNVITEIGTKQDTIDDGDLTIAKTDGLQTALNNKYDDTGGTIGGNVTISGDLVIGTTNVITEIGTKQDTIDDGDLTIAKTDGLQTALDNKYDDTGGTISGSVTISGDLVVGTTNVITEIGTKQDTIDDGDLTIAKTDGLQTVLTTLNQKYIPYNPDSFGLKAVSSWTERTSSSGLWYRVVYAPELNLFIAISENTFSDTMMSSANGFDWDYVSSSPNFLNDIVWSEELSLFVVVSRTSPYLRTSSDGVTWTGQSVPTTESLQAIAWSPELGLFAVVSFDGDLITSPDGLNWTSRTSPNVIRGYSMCWSKELAVFIVGYQNELAISSNGIDWTSIDTVVGIWRSIAWSPKLGLFVAVSNSRSSIITSPDGLNWTEISVSFRYSGIVWSDIGIFVAVGTYGYMMYSNDGINWVENDDVMSGVLQGVCWSDELGIFVVVGSDTVYTSTLKGRPPTMFNTFDSEFNSIDEDGTWNFNSLTLPTIGDVEDAIQGKEPTIQDNGLTIAKTDGLQTALDNKYDDTGGTIGGNVTISGDLVVGSTNIIDEIGTKQDTIDETTHLIVDRITTESTTIDCEMNGRLLTANKKMFINNAEKDLDGLTFHNLQIVSTFLSGNYVSYSSGLFTFQNLTRSGVHLFIVTLVLSVESDTYDGRVNWRLTPYLDNNNYAGYGRFYTTTEGATEISRYSTLMVRTLVGAMNGQVYRLALDCNKEGDSTFGSSMNGLKVRNASIFTFEYVGIN
jgi:hypothetical protein